MLRLIGVEENLKLMVDQTINFMKVEKPNVPNSVWSEVKSKLDYDRLLMKLVPVYSRHYTQGEVQELISFFESPVGKKYIAKGAVIGQESYMVGKDIGKAIGENINQNLRKLGYY